MLFDLSNAPQLANIWVATPHTMRVAYVLIAAVVVFKWCGDIVIGLLDEYHKREQKEIYSELVDVASERDHIESQIKDDILHGWGDSESEQYMRRQLDYEFEGNE